MFRLVLVLAALLILVVSCFGDGSDGSRDRLAPVITLNGSAELRLLEGGDYIEQGATAVDDRDGAVPVSIAGDVDTSLPGAYSVTYTATDRGGNRAEAVRTVEVIASGWYPVPLPLPDYDTVKRVLVSPDNPAALIAVVDDVYDDSELAVFQTWDLGETWRETAVSLDMERELVVHLLQNPMSFDDFYMSAQPEGTTNTGLLDPLRQLLQFDSGAREIQQITDATVGYFEVQSVEGDLLVFRSSSSGSGGPASLDLSTNGGPFVFIGGFFPGWSVGCADEECLESPLWLMSSAADGSIAVRANGDFVSNDRGQNWRELPPLEGAGPVTLHPTDASLIYARQEREQMLWRYDPQYGAWVEVVAPVAVERFALSRDRPEIVSVAGESLTAVHISFDGGITWQQRVGGVDIPPTASVPRNDYFSREELQLSGATPLLVTGSAMYIYLDQDFPMFSGGM